MVLWSKFRLVKYRDDDHQEDAFHFKNLEISRNGAYLNKIPKLNASKSNAWKKSSQKPYQSVKLYSLNFTALKLDRVSYLEFMNG